MNKRTGTAFVIIGLLVAMGLSHKLTGTTLVDIAGNEPTQASQSHEDEAEEESPKVVLPDPMGSKDADIQIKVYVTSDNECDETTFHEMQDIGRDFGDDVYIEFADLLEEEVLREAQEAKIGCKAGLTINGKSKYLLPERGIEGTILLDGPIGQLNYDINDVKAIITYHLEYKKTQENGDKDE
jgi:hypothetical protein